MKDTLIGAIVLLIAAIYFLNGTAMYIAIVVILFGVISSLYDEKHPEKKKSDSEIEEDEIEEDEEIEEDTIEDDNEIEDNESFNNIDEIEHKHDSLNNTEKQVVESANLADNEIKSDENKNTISKETIQHKTKVIEDTSTKEVNTPSSENKHNTKSNKEKSKKGFNKTLTIVIIVLALIFGLSKCTNSNDDTTKETKQSEKTVETKKKKKKKKEEKTFKEFENTSLKDSYQALKDTGYTITYRYQKNDYECTQEYSNLSNDSEFLNGWVITSIANVDNKKKSFTVYIQTQESIDADAQRSANTKALTSKLEEVAAWEAVQQYGLTQYSDFKVHYLTGKLANEPKDENTWSLKASVTYRNELGNKVKGTCEAEVTGTTAAPQVTYFLVY